MNSVSLVEVIGPCWRLSTPIVSRDCAREGIGKIRMSGSELIDGSRDERGDDPVS